MRNSGLFLLLLLGGSYSAAQNDAPSNSVPEANPSRPTVTNPATVTPVGYLQFETGYFTGEDSPESSRVTDVNEVVKLTVDPKLEFLVQTFPFYTGKVNGGTQSGWGDVVLGVQGVAMAGKGLRPTISLSYLHQARNSGLPDIDQGSASNSALVLVSGDVRKFHYDSNAVFNEMEDGRTRRAQFGQTLSVTHGVGKRFSITGEVWHFTQPFLRGNAVGNLWAGGYTVKPNLVLDAGFDVGLTGTSTRSEVFFGFTYLLPKRLW